MIFQSIQAVGTDMATGTKWMLRNQAILLILAFNSRASRKASITCKGLMMTLNNRVTFSEFQNTGS